MELPDIQKELEAFTEQYQLYVLPEIAALDLASEVGELAKEVLQTTKYGTAEPVYREELGDELGDVLYALITLANHYDVDLEAALESRLDSYKRRIANGGMGSKHER